jgi:CRP-like cAMP-binding protein
VTGNSIAGQRSGNDVLRELARADARVFAELARDLEPQVLQRGTALDTPRTVPEFVYFVESGLVSIVARTRGGSSVEVAVTGREGVAGIADVLGRQPLPYDLVVQLPGLAYRVPKAVIREHILTCSALHELLMDCSQRMMHQLAQSALCNRFHTSVQRLARWLLLTAERADAQRFELTHEFMAQMVGAPRSAVSEAASTLRARGVIDYRRGVLTIRHARRLQRIACECFDAMTANGHGGIPPPSPRGGQRSAKGSGGRHAK